MLSSIAPYILVGLIGGGIVVWLIERLLNDERRQGANDVIEADDKKAVSVTEKRAEILVQKPTVTETAKKLEQGKF